MYKDLHPNTREELIRKSQNFIVVDGQPINPDTGEILDNIDIQTVITKPQVTAKRAIENLVQHQTDHGGFFFAYYEVCKSMTDRFPQLTQSDLARLMFIGTYLSWQTNHLVYDNGRPINKKALGELLGMSRNKYSEFYRKLIYNEIIYEQKSGLVMNATVFYRGTDKKASIDAKKMQYTRLFRKTIRELYAMFSGRSIKKLGVLYAVLPYINFNYNIVCNNPQEVQEAKVKPMAVSELADKLGYSDAKKLIPVLREIRYEGKPVFGFFETDGDARKKKIVVNTSVVYAGNGKHLDAINILFR
ncbi:hypothetical protein [Virgibacillus salexigens]|uniref:Plasmid replication protein RepL domain-containing protein n=1 Tax=Virgibacillus kapii TaxID=1638645 RepID=A0ABQ2D8K6_9BACI|nr:hypothetical protein [Virgibacillus kapii]GGJ49640.1 hypothetical protein GCM10007111_09750 [Virgibacillus kapii]